MAENKEQIQNAGKFQDAIFDYAKIQSEKILQEVREKQQEELKNIQKAIREETAEYTKTHLEKINSKILREIAHREQDVKREILKLRQEITEKVFAEACQRLLDFTETEEYLPFLLKQVEKVKSLFQTDDVVFVMRKADEGFQPAIRESFGKPCTFQIDTNIHIGGLRVKSDSLGKMVDQSLDSLLKDQEEWFEIQSGLSVV